MAPTPPAGKTARLASPGLGSSSGSGSGSGSSSSSASRPTAATLSTSQRRLVLTTASSLQAQLQPALKAYALGYAIDVLPALVKVLLRFVTNEARRIRAAREREKEEREVAREEQEEVGAANGKGKGKASTLQLIAPAVNSLPSLLSAILRALLAALGPQGMALSCFWAMAGWRLSDSLVWWPIARWWTLRIAGAGAGAASTELRDRLRTARIAASFVSASISSAVALMFLQYGNMLVTRDANGSARTASGTLPPRPDISIVATSPELKAVPLPGSDTDGGASAAAGAAAGAGAGTGTGAIANVGSRLLRSSVRPFMRAVKRAEGGKTGNPTPLAPGGHFLARITSLSLPGSPPTQPSPGMTSPTESRMPLSPLPGQRSSSSSEEKKGISAESGGALPDSGKTAQGGLGRPSPTLDLTLFALVRGMDTFARALPHPLKGKGSSAAAVAAATTNIKGKGKASRGGILSKIVGGVADQAEGAIFVICCAQIMWAWFYHPKRLPPTYIKWITNLATMDQRLLVALRCMRGVGPFEWKYGDSQMPAEGIALLGSLSEELGYPYEWGDPTRLPATAADARAMLETARAENAAARAAGKEVLPDPTRGGEPGFILAGAAGPRGRGEMGGVPCEVVHCGTGGSSCMANSALRWIRGWKTCMYIYVPVHTLPRLLFNPAAFLQKPGSTFLKILLSSARSASFLASFIASIWFMVCLGRTTLLPRLFPNLSFRFLDAGLGPLLGSIACGFSVFIEEKRKRAEMALYVAPRALFAVAEMAKPGWASGGARGALWAERLLFGLSAGVVITAGRYRPDLLRGITSSMAWVVKSPSHTKFASKSS